jgi:hypothetical protein
LARRRSEIHGYASRRLGSSLADDVASETFLIGFDRRHRYDLAQSSARHGSTGSPRISSHGIGGQSCADTGRSPGSASPPRSTAVPSERPRGSTSRRCAGGLPLRWSRSPTGIVRSCSSLRGPAPPLFDGYRALAALPTHPNDLRRWAYERARNTTGGGMHDDGDVFLFFNHMLRGNVLPPKLEAAIFRVLKQLPGVTVLDTVDVLGRPAIALGLGTSDWLHEELLLDKETYAYRGERSTVVRDATIDPLKAGNSTGQVKKGSKVVAARVVTAIVVEPGQRP